MEKRKIVEYKIISHDKSSTVTNEVNKHLRDGWELYGYADFSDGWYKRQVVVRYETMSKDDNEIEKNKIQKTIEEIEKILTMDRSSIINFFKGFVGTRNSRPVIAVRGSEIFDVVTNILRRDGLYPTDFNFHNSGVIVHNVLLDNELSNKILGNEQHNLPIISQPDDIEGFDLALNVVVSYLNGEIVKLKSEVQKNEDLIDIQNTIRKIEGIVSYGGKEMVDFFKEFISRRDKKPVVRAFGPASRDRIMEIFSSRGLIAESPGSSEAHVIVDLAYLGENNDYPEGEVVIDYKDVNSCDVVTITIEKYFEAILGKLRETLVYMKSGIKLS